MSDTFTCGSFVTARIRSLLGSDPARLRPASRAMLARLRDAVAQEPGTVPAIWSVTAEGLPARGGQVEQRRIESAVHAALTLFATHQQARGASMHTDARRFGGAVRLLARSSAGDQDPHETPVYRRFTAMATTTDLSAALTHARGIVAQLRDADIAFDYGRFADDLYRFQVPSLTADVRRGWGRDFHRFTASPESSEGNN